MKINCLIFLFVIAFFNVNAQDTGISNSIAQEGLNNANKKNIPRKGFSLEPIVGLGTSEAVQNGSNNLGGRIGIGVVYMFNDHWGISSGLQFQEYSTKIVSGKDSVYIYNGGVAGYWAFNSLNVNYDFTYLELPVLVRYISSQDRKFGAFAEAGVIVGCLFYTSEARTLNITDIDDSNNYFSQNGGNIYSDSKSLGETKAYTNYFTLQEHLAFGLFILISQRCSIIMDFSINKGLTNVGNSSEDFATFNVPLYYYNKNNNPNISNYGTNFSEMVSVRLNIKLGSN